MNERIIANNHYPGLDVVRVIAIAGIVGMSCGIAQKQRRFVQRFVAATVTAG